MQSVKAKRKKWKTKREESAKYKFQKKEKKKFSPKKQNRSTIHSSTSGKSTLASLAIYTQVKQQTHACNNQTHSTFG